MSIKAGKRCVRAAVSAALAVGIVLAKNVPYIGATPWASAATDASALLLLLLCAGRFGLAYALPAALLLPLTDWLQGSLAGFLVPFSAAGYVLGVLVWRFPARFRAAKAALCALVAAVLPIIGTAAGYMALKSLGASEAVRTALRSRWYLAAWFAGACVAAAWIEWKTARE